MKQQEGKSAMADVVEFMLMASQPILDKPIIPAKRAKLRYDLIAEELKELKEAIENGDIVKVADAMVDLQYVLLGAVQEFGLGKKFPVLWDKVQTSNMSKRCDDVDTAVASHKKLFEEGKPCIIVPSGPGYVLQRIPDKKILKPITFIEAGLEECFTQEEIEYSVSELDEAIVLE